MMKSQAFRAFTDRLQFLAGLSLVLLWLGVLRALAPNSPANFP
jgi:hypothetical protein